MRALRLVAALVSALLSSSCLVVSLHPVYEPETIAFDPSLLGTWTAAEEEVTLLFERAGWHSYHVTITERDHRHRVSARLTRVAEQTFLDVSPLDGADVPLLALPAHAFYRVETPEDGRLSLADLNYEALERRVREGTAGLAMAIDARTHVVITAETAAIRRWLAAHATDDAMFAAPTTFTRR